tara:strand:- start:472 stop:1248 length:777 start_codon:yes stop_codon:yes gene_type:complete
VKGLTALLDYMGYDVKVLETNYQRWFSVWDWYRCLLTALFGAGVIEEYDYKGHLLATTNLQAEVNGAPTDPEREEEYEFVRKKRKKKSESGETNIIMTNFEYDEEGFVIGGWFETDQDASVDSIAKVMLIQAKSNQLLQSNREELGLDRDVCIELTSMNGNAISSEVAFRLGMGAACGLAYTKHYEMVSKIIEAWCTVIGMPEEPVEEVRSKLEVMREKGKIGFEIDEYVEDQQMAAIIGFVITMLDAAGVKSDFIIT